MPQTPPSIAAELLFVEGPEAGSFLQTQLSSDVSTLSTSRWQFSAWLDPQGRVKTLAHLVRLDEERWLLLLRGGDAASLAQELRRYVFRARVSLSSDHTWWISEAAPLPEHEVQASEQAILLGCGDHALELSGRTGGSNVWRTKHIHAGWPWLVQDMPAKLLAPSLSLHRLGAVALSKGCYPGQEIVARLHYRGGNKRHMHTVELDGTHAPGTHITYRADPHGIQLLDTVQANDKTVALAVMGDAVMATLNDRNTLQLDDGQHMQLQATWPT